ncbi:hypothetical protein [Tardiphaga sp. P9-11]|jgi:hypothetical protein|uniref:hypothetical protein n=1 Tax=Tardiphaga sp. P9-11 TaxID=2024614 RepID=UPI0015629901|nr:hypothetical protein [Tardiphaga sp. P9-11]
MADALSKSFFMVVPLCCVLTIEKQRGGSLVASRQALPHRCLPTATKQQHFLIYSFSGGAEALLVQCSHELDRVFQCLDTRFRLRQSCGSVAVN